MSLDAILPPLLETDDRRLLKATVRDFLASALPWSTVRKLDEAGEFPREAWNGLARLGLLGIGAAESLGGSGGTLADSVIVALETARCFPSLTVDYVLCAMATRTLAEFGNDTQRSWLSGLSDGSRIFAYGISEPSGGTDAIALKTRAVETAQGWVVTGQKLWTSLAGQAEQIFVLARTAPPDPPNRRSRGLSLIAVPAQQAGVTVNRVHLAGMRAAGTCEVFFDGAIAPPDHLLGPAGGGMGVLKETLNVERILAAALSVGIAWQALEMGVQYAASREAFGRPIGGFQALQHPLADRATELAAAILLLERATLAYEANEDTMALAGMAKLAAGETAARTVDSCMRVMAAMGLAAESPMQMLFRDARLQLFSPVSNEMVRNIIGERLGLPRSY